MNDCFARARSVKCLVFRSVAAAAAAATCIFLVSFYTFFCFVCLLIYFVFLIIFHFFPFFIYFYILNRGSEVVSFPLFSTLPCVRFCMVHARTQPLFLFRSMCVCPCPSVCVCVCMCVSFIFFSCISSIPFPALTFSSFLPFFSRYPSHKQHVLCLRGFTFLLRLKTLIQPTFLVLFLSLMLIIQVFCFHRT